MQMKKKVMVVFFLSLKCHVCKFHHKKNVLTKKTHTQNCQRTHVKVVHLEKCQKTSKFKLLYEKRYNLIILYRFKIFFFFKYDTSVCNKYNSQMICLKMY